jgi:hypothetical protein
LPLFTTLCHSASLAAGVYPNNMTCRVGKQGWGNSHTPHLRGCIEGSSVKGAKGGNPVGTAFSLDGSSGTIANHNCAEEKGTCVSVVMATEAADPTFSIADCKSAGAIGWTKVAAGTY